MYFYCVCRGSVITERPLLEIWARCSAAVYHGAPAINTWPDSALVCLISQNEFTGENISTATSRDILSLFPQCKFPSCITHIMTSPEPYISVLAVVVRWGNITCCTRRRRHCVLNMYSWFDLSRALYALILKKNNKKTHACDFKTLMGASAFQNARSVTHGLVSVTSSGPGQQVRKEE